MNHRCPNCAKDLAARKLLQSVIARWEIDCRYCGRRIRLNVHPLELKVVVRRTCRARLAAGKQCPDPARAVRGRGGGRSIADPRADLPQNLGALCAACAKADPLGARFAIWTDLDFGVSEAMRPSLRTDSRGPSRRDLFVNGAADWTKASVL